LKKFESFKKDTELLSLEMGIKQTIKDISFPEEETHLKNGLFSLKNSCTLCPHSLYQETKFATVHYY